MEAWRPKIHMQSCSPCLFNNILGKQPPAWKTLCVEKARAAHSSFLHAQLLCMSCQFSARRKSFQSSQIKPGKAAQPLSTQSNAASRISSISANTFSQPDRSGSGSSLWIHSGGAIPVAVPEALAQSKLGLVIWPHFQKHASLFRGASLPRGQGGH